MENYELMEGEMIFKGRKKGTAAQWQDGKDRVQKGQRKINKNNSQNEKRERRKLYDYDDQNLSKFNRKPLSMALKTEMRMHFILVRA